MARPDNLECHNPHTRQGKSFRGAHRGLPNMGARKTELGEVHLNGLLNPDASVESLRAYLGVDKSVEGYSRNLRNPRHKLPR